MNLRRLKKQLKKQQSQRKNKYRWYWLLLPLAGLAVLPIYLQQQKAAPERLLDKGLVLESQGKAAEAQLVYQRLINDYPQHKQTSEALLRSALIWQLDKRNEQQALLNYLQLEHDFPESQLLLTARLEAAKIVKYSQRDYSQAIGIYQRLLDAATIDSDRYLYEIADCYYLLDNYNQARIELETLEKNYPESSLIPDALYRKGGLHLLEKQSKEARRDWMRLVDEFPDSSYSFQARFNLAKLLEEEDQLQAALEQYEQLTDYPRKALLQAKVEHLKKRIAAKKKAI